MPCKNCKHYYLYSNCGNICNTSFAAGITSGTTAASSYVISNGTTAAKSSVISNEVSTDTSVSWPQAPDITCESAILVDADTGSILYEKMHTVSAIQLQQLKSLQDFLLLRTVISVIHLHFLLPQLIQLIRLKMPTLV